MSASFRELVEAMRGEELATVRTHPVVERCKALRGADAATFVRAYRAYLADVGPVVSAYGTAADIAAFSVAQAVLVESDLDGEALLGFPRWPSDETWSAAMLARARDGRLATDEIVRALDASEGFGAGATSLLPFGGERWAVELRARVAAWPKKRAAAWADFVAFARTTDLPLRPSTRWVATREPKAIAKALAPCLPDVRACLDHFDAPRENVADANTPSGLTLAAEENAKLLHGLVLFYAALRPAGWDATLRHLGAKASARVEGLGAYLPKLAARVTLALAA